LKKVTPYFIETDSSSIQRLYFSEALIAVASEDFTVKPITIKYEICWIQVNSVTGRDTKTFRFHKG